MNKKYTYDGLGRLFREDNADLNKTFVFTYDKSGNILSRKEYAFTVGSLNDKAPTKTVNCTYQRNQLWSYDGEGCSYNVLGNPIIYRGKMATWTKIHRLASFNGVDFAYNYAGIRTSKTSGNVTTKYAYDNHKLIAEQKGSNLNTKLVYYYGFDGVTAFNYGGENYFYQKNTFGDIVGIYKSSKQLVAKYVYDAWGNHKVLNPDGTENTSADFIGNINPFRYRSYYFDVETGLYYLNARYYDPTTARFISMDDISYIQPEIINGLNLYAYCNNNPVMYSDPSGHIALTALIIGAIIGAVIGAGSSIISQGIENNWEWDKFDVGLFIADTIFGAVDGAFSGLGLSLGVSFLIDMGLSFAQSFTTSLIQGSEYTGLDFLLDTGSTMVSFGVSSLVGRGLNKAFKNSFSVDIDPERLQGKWKSAVKSLQSNEGPRKKARAISNKRYVKNTIAMGIGYYSIGGLTNGALSGLLGRI